MDRKCARPGSHAVAIPCTRSLPRSRSVIEIAKLNGLRRARLRTCRGQPSFLAVVTERTFERATIVRPSVDHAKRTGNNAIAATVADIGLHKYGSEFRADDRSRGTCFKAAGVGAVLAHVGEKDPAERIFGVGHLRARDLRLLEKQDVPPSRSSQRLVLSYEIPLHTKPSSGTSFHSLQATSHALQPMQIVASVRNAVVLVSSLPIRHEAPARRCADSRDRLQFSSRLPRSTLQSSPLVSIMRTFGSSEIATRSLPISPFTSP